MTIFLTKLQKFSLLNDLTLQYLKRNILEGGCIQNYAKINISKSADFLLLLFPNVGTLVPGVDDNERKEDNGTCANIWKRRRRFVNNHVDKKREEDNLTWPGWTCQVVLLPLLVNLVVHEPPPPLSNVGTGPVVLLPLLVIHL